MTDKMAHQVIEHENMAVNIARIVYERYEQCPDYDGFIGDEDLKDIHDPQERQRQHIPSEIALSDSEFVQIVETPSKLQEQLIRDLIKEKNNNLYQKINTYKCIQKTMPETDNSYKKHILDVSNKIKANEKFVMDINKKDREINSCQFYIDKKEKRIIVIVYSGALNRE
jgi:hypothetical protein